MDPIGTAGTQSGFLLVQWPRPWPGDIGLVEELAALEGDLKVRGIRLQAVEAVSPAEDGRTHVMLYRRPDSAWFDGYVGHEVEAHADAVTVAVQDLLAGGGAPITSKTDVLICTHGARDTCCGSRGTRLAFDLRDAVASPVRLWRSSHLGGHRFAPTVLVLPEGTAWAYLTAADAVAIVERSGDLAGLLRLYRGSAGMPTPEHQALERVAFGRVGWEWLNGRRCADVPAGGRRGIEWRGPDGRQQHWDGLVVEGRSLDVPACRATGPTKTASELVVAAFRFREHSDTRRPSHD